MGKKIDLDAQKSKGITSRSKNVRHQKNHFEPQESPSFNDESQEEYTLQNEIDEQEEINEENSEPSNYTNENLNEEQVDEEQEEYDSQDEMVQQAETNKENIKKTTSIAIKLLMPKKFKIIFIIIIAITVLPMLLTMMVVASFEEESETGLSGYDYYPGACDKVRVKGGDLISMEEYVAGVIAVEVPGFTDEILKTFAIGARTYVIQGASKVGDDDDCYYDVTNTSASFQAYKSGTVDEQYKNAANATRGLIVTLDGKPKMYYDASCVYTAAQARSKTPSGTFDDNYVYIRYGEETISGDNYQKIDKEKVKSIGTLNYYINKAENGTACSDNHGWGMSQNGSAYLEATEGYNYEKIINYYYQNKEKLVSIYKGTAGYSGNYPIEPNNELYSNNKFLINKTLSDVLSDNGSSVEEFNGFLKSEVEKAGIGTRNAVIAAAVNLIGSLAEKGYKLNYQWGGKYQAIGVKPDWGTHIKNSYCDTSYKSINSDISICHTNYSWTSFDCSGFVTWAIINGMQGTNSTGGIQVNQSNIFNSKATSLNPNKAVCKVGGVLQSSGHIVLVVGHDDANKQYIVAESTGSRINTGYGGVKLSYYPYGKEGYWCSNLDDIYGD